MAFVGGKDTVSAMVVSFIGRNESLRQEQIGV